MDKMAFHNACRILLNIDLDELERAGVIHPGNKDRGGSSWKRFNDEPLIFILKLPTERFEKLWQLIEERQPEKWRSK
ncbi:MAG: hypothetical protein KDJ69_12110 [Nitratireductor sp.]|nr:hypothetical protein [Nitratireductor sp.]